MVMKTEKKSVRQHLKSWISILSVIMDCNISPHMIFLRGTLCSCRPYFYSMQIIILPAAVEATKKVKFRTEDKL